MGVEVGEEMGDWAVGEGWGTEATMRAGGAHRVNAGHGTQQFHGPRWTQWPITTGGLAVATPQAAQAPIGRLAVAAVGVAHGTVVQGH